MRTATVDPTRGEAAGALTALAGAKYSRRRFITFGHLGEGILVFTEIGGRG